MIAIICIACLIIAVLCYLLYKQSRKQQEIITINLTRQQYNQQLEESISSLEQAQKDLILRSEAKTAELARLTSSVDATAREYENIARERAEREYKKKTEILEQKYQKRVEQIDEDTRERLLDYKLVQNKIKDLQAKQLAYIQMKQREEEMTTKQDYYRLIISEQDIQDVKFLREVQSRLAHKEAIDKVIWDVYFKPAYDTLMSHLFPNSEKVCGIYRITCLENDKSYIGQSVDIRERFRQHIKSSLTYASTSNKLYQEIKKYGVENFTFEILERVDRTQLNEREIYWIDFCKTRDYGLNSTKGGA